MNPIWTHYCANQVESWLAWLNTVHINSYLELTERFITTHPYFVPSSSNFDEAQQGLFDKLIMDRDFINTLSEKGLSIWANSNFVDFIACLEIYGVRYPDVRRLTNFMNLHLEWFTRVYQFFRADMILELREEGRNL